MKRALISFCIFLAPLFSLGSGVLQLTGRLRNFDTTSIEVEDRKKIYRIEKDKLSPGQIDELKKKKAGADLQLAVPFDAISEVKLKK